MIRSLTQNLRLGIVSLAAVSVSLPIAWISLSKVLLVFCGIAVLLTHGWRQTGNSALSHLWTPRAVLLVLLFFAFSLAWTEVDSQTATWAFVKHLKLLEIVLILGLIRTLREARIAVTAFGYGQIFLLASSWALFAGVPVPWVTDPIGKNVIFSSYLDQSIMLAAAAAIFWHLRSEPIFPGWLAIAFSLLAMVNVLLLLEGRTGYLVALVLLSMAAMWAMPARWRLATLTITPLLLVVLLVLGSTQVRERLRLALNESQNFASRTQNPGPTERPLSDSSMGWRLNAWHRSLQAMQDKPVLGHGVGSWSPAVKKFEGNTANQNFGEGTRSNPHQEFLLWGVELGIAGTILLLLLMASVVRDCMKMPTPYRRAVLSVLAASFLACLFNSALYDDLMGDYLCISLALVMALGLHSRHGESI